MSSFATGRSKEVYGSKISKRNGYDADSFTYYPVAIIGAGESGIAMGCRLKQELGFDQFRIFERQSGWGGTWWINRYPGVACDVPAVFYSFSFAPNHKWTSLYPAGPEITKYLDTVCEKFEIIDKIQLNTDVSECRWNEAEGVWELTIHELVPGTGDLSSYDRLQRIKEHGESSVYVRSENIRAKVLVSCVGGLVEPNRWPESIPGKEKFQGDIFHSARWKYDVDLKDKDVVVLGTGCSAAQFVPELTKTYGAKSVTQVMRSPPWVVPKQSPPFGEEKWSIWGPRLNTYVPGFAKSMRMMVATRAEFEFRLFGGSKYSEKERAKLEVELIAHMKKTVPKKYHEMLTPDYGVGCKRRIFDATWFKSLNDDKIELTTLPLTHVSEKSVTLGPGRNFPKSGAPEQEIEIPADVIILGNGFEVLHWFHPLEVVGRGGKSLQDVFKERGGPQMYMGNAMDGFPNFFVIFGPNTATGHSSVVLATENMVNLTLKLVAPVLNGDAEFVEVKKAAEIAWTADIQKSLKGTVWHSGGCQSWYKGADDWNSTVYPYSQIWFTLLCMFPKYRDWTYQYTTKGLLKKRAKEALKIAAATLAIVAAYRARQAGIPRIGVKEIPFILKAVVAKLIYSSGGGLQKIAKLL